MNKSKLTQLQVRQFGPRPIDGWGEGALIKATVRYDDQCRNGHNTFSITGEIYLPRRPDGGGGGCLHDEISKAFPELAPLIKWHLCSSDGPMHYLENTVYLAGDRDYNGLRLGEFKQHTSRGPNQAGGKRGVPCWELSPAPDLGQDCHGSIYAAEKPAPVTLEWRANGIAGKGKVRELDNARSAAIWQEATDAQLCAEPQELKAALIARLPALMEEFKAAVESLGFTY